MTDILEPLVVIGGDNLFHSQKEDEILHGLRAKWLGDKRQETIYLNGGWDALLPRAVPQGSGNKLFGAYYNKFDGADRLTGGFRTQEGSAWGILKLQERARQLQQLDDAEPLTTEPSQAVSQITMGVPEQITTAINLLLDEIRLAITGSNYKLVMPQEMRKLFGLFRDVVLKMPLVSLQKYKGQVSALLERLEPEYDDGADTITLWEMTLFKINKLLDIAIVSFHKQPQFRRAFFLHALPHISAKHFSSTPRIEFDAATALSEYEAGRDADFAAPTPEEALREAEAAEAADTLPELEGFGDVDGAYFDEL